MQIKSTHTIAAVCVLAVFITTCPLYAQRTKSSLSAGLQRNAEKGLKDNRYFFYFINGSVTNVGSDDDKLKFKEAVQRDIVAQLLYMRFNFSDSFTEIRHAQELLIDVYRSMLERSLKDTKKLLHHFAPSVIKSNIYSARHYLELGYRETTSASVHMVMADNFKENLYSMRLYEYVAAIKKSQQGKRYAFYAILESSYPRRDVSKFAQLGYKDLHKLVEERAPAASGAVPSVEGKALLNKLNTMDELVDKHAFFKRRKRKAETEKISAQMEQLRKEIEDLDKEYVAKYKEYGEKREFFSLHHADAYYKVPSGKSLFDAVWQNPQLHEIKELKGYLKK